MTACPASFVAFPSPSDLTTPDLQEVVDEAQDGQGHRGPQYQQAGDGDTTEGQAGDQVREPHGRHDHQASHRGRAHLLGMLRVVRPRLPDALGSNRGDGRAGWPPA